MQRATDGSLEQLQLALERAGYDGSAADALHPGKARQELVAWAISRLLGGGKGMCDVWPLVSAAAASHGFGSDISGSDQLLSEEERSAQRCQRVLGLLGVRASMDDIRGCGKGGSTALLMQLVELVAAVDAHRSAGGETASSSGIPSSDGAAASSLAPQQLMDAACELGPRLWCDTMQLFPRDMAALMEEYRDAGQQLSTAAGELLQRAATQQDRPSCIDGQQAPTAEDLTKDMGAASAAVGQLIEAGEQLAGVFEQELSVWAEDTDAPGGSSSNGGAPGRPLSLEQPQGRQAVGGDKAAWRLGVAARDVISGYNSISSLIDALGLLMDMHATLQDVPREWLAEVAVVHTAAAEDLGESSTLLSNN